MKTITLNIKGGSQSQWSTLILELNLMKKAWKRYGVEIELKAPNLNKIIKLGTSHGEKNLNYKKKKKNHIINIFG
tara:strand:- start:187 stop:411 length:225 start_codon:yes stop_codon:yes gene_type:complete